MARRFPVKELPAYIIAQVIGGIFAAGCLYQIASGKPGFVLGGFASNGYADHSPDHYSLAACFLCEALCTAFFLLVILGSTDERSPKGFAPIAIGLALTLIHLISIPVTNTSVNPARSTAMALFVHGWAISQLWLFWLAPILGAIAGAVISNAFLQGAAGSRSARPCRSSWTRFHIPARGRSLNRRVTPPARPLACDIRLLLGGTNLVAGYVSGIEGVTEPCFAAFRLRSSHATRTSPTKTAVVTSPIYQHEE